MLNEESLVLGFLSWIHPGTVFFVSVQGSGNALGFLSALRKKTQGKLVCEARVTELELFTILVVATEGGKLFAFISLDENVGGQVFWNNASSPFPSVSENY